MKRAVLAAAVGILSLSLVVGCGFQPDPRRGLEAYSSGDWETAFRHLEPIAAQGFPEPQRLVGLMYLNGNGVPADRDAAMRWLELAAEQDSVEAQLQLARLHVWTKPELRDDTVAKRWYEKAADLGDLDAQTELGLLDLPIHTRPERDVDWASIGMNYVLEKRFKEDSESFTRGIRSIRKAADNGHIRAQFWLGSVLLMLNTAEAVEMGLEHLNAASGKGYLAAQIVLGDYFSGNGSQPHGGKQEDEAIRFYKMCANTEGPYQSYCQARIGDLFHDEDLMVTGRGSKNFSDPEKAAHWYDLAADRGYWLAQHSLGLMSLYGDGVPQDYQRAARLLQRAAEEGSEDSQFVLGLMYMAGKGVPRDLVTAHMWFNLSAGNEFILYDSYLIEKVVGIDRRSAIDLSAKKLRDMLGKEMSAAQLAQAQSLASSWKPKDPGSGSSGTGRVATGSGFRINRPGQVLTNHHVVNECSEVLVGGKPASIFAVDVANDLAVLDGPPGSFSKLSGAKEVRAGARVVASGFPLQGVLGSGLQTTSGEVSSLSGVGSDTRFLQISVPVNPGSSGGPLFDSYGMVAGVVTARLDDLAVAESTGSLPENVGFALRTSVVRTFLDANNIEYSTGRGWFKKDAEKIAERAQEVVVLVECVN